MLLLHYNFGTVLKIKSKKNLYMTYKLTFDISVMKAPPRKDNICASGQSKQLISDLYLQDSAVVTTVL